MRNRHSRGVTKTVPVTGAAAVPNEVGNNEAGALVLLNATPLKGITTACSSPPADSRC